MESNGVAPNGSAPTASAIEMSTVPLGGQPSSYDVENVSVKRGLVADSESSYDMQHAANGSRKRPNAPAVPEILEVEPQACWYHAAFHSVTAVVGAGVLGLPYAFSWLGWVAGEISLFIACAVSLYTSYQLAVLHHYQGVRHNRYRDLGRAIFGPRLGVALVAPFQFSVMVGLGITYTVTAAQSFKGIADGMCRDELETECDNGLTRWICIFGALQLLLSQLPHFHDLWWISLGGAIMSVGYCLLAFILSLTSSSNSYVYPGSTQVSGADKVFGIFSALGAITFAYGGHSVLLEIQATLAEPPKASRSMMKGVLAAYVIVVLAYFSVATAGYAAFGDSVNPDILLSTGHPRWLVNIANLMVVGHVIASYQVFSNPLFEAWEGFLTKRGYFPSNYPWLMRLTLRSMYVAFTTFVAIMIPFFQDLMGLIGAIGFLPMTFIMPALMWLVARDTVIWEKILNVSIVIGFSIIAVVAFVGSLRNVIVHSQSYDLFA